MIKQINKNTKDKKEWVKIMGLIILLVLVFWWFYSNKLEEQEKCVDRCVSDNYDCAFPSHRDNLGSLYISEWEYYDCVDELEYCVNRCKN